MSQESRRLNPQDLSRAVLGLTGVTMRHGVLLTLFNIVTLNSLLFFTFWTDSPALFVGLAIATATFYSSVMITSHDAIHHTLSGKLYFDEIVPRCFAYFIFWPHGLYGELHKLHHKMNGRDLADPERPTFTVAEYRAASRFGRWQIRNQWWLALFVYGGVGMLLRHAARGFKLWGEHRAVRRAMITDAIGIGLSFVVVLSVVYALNIGSRFVVYIFFVERIVGFFMQMRSHVEHYGLNVDAGSLIETRLANCRNIVTNRFASRYFNGLNFHSVHHAFPRIPYYHLREAHERIAALCAKSGRSLPEGQGYVRTCWHLARNPVLVDEHGGEVSARTLEAAS